MIRATFRFFLISVAVIFGISAYGGDIDYLPDRVPDGRWLAPGVQQDRATMETLEWIWALGRVPFPSQIDRGQWTDYYFSYDGSGDWPAGDDAEDGLTPGNPKQTVGGVGGALDTCFTAYARCNFDYADDWEDGGGFGTGFGVVADADITNISSCPATFEGARAQPCFWMRSSPGGRAHFDATGTAAATACMILSTIAPTHLLVEAIDITCDSTGAEKVALDAQEAGIVTYVGSDAISVSPGNSANIASAHDVSVTHVYGDSSGGYGGAPTGTAATIGINGSGALALHSRGVWSAAAQANDALTSKVVDITQGSGAIDASLVARALVNPAVMLITGAHLQSNATADNSGSPIINLVPHSDSSGDVDQYLQEIELTTISTYLDQRSPYAAPQTIRFQHVNAVPSSKITFTGIHTTFGDNQGAAAPFHLVLDGAMNATSSLDVLLAGSVFEAYGAGEQIIRVADTNFPDLGLGKITLVDYTYDQVADQWRIWHTTGVNCNVEDTPAALETCIAAGPGTDILDLLSGDVAVVGDVNIATPDKGFCDTDTPTGCAGINASAASYYTTTWDDRLAIPAFIAGRKLVGFKGEPTVYNDAGKAR